MRVNLSILLATFLLICCGGNTDSKDAVDSSAGDGGRDVSAETAPSSGSDAGADAGANANADAGACFPACIQTLFADCFPAGACISQRMGGTNRKCFGNGVKVVETVDEAAGRGTTTVRTPGGGVCYTVDLLVNGASGGGSLTYRNPSGAMVAVVNFAGQAAMGSVSCGGGAAMPINFNVEACVGSPNGIPGASPPEGCTAGTCSP